MRSISIAPWAFVIIGNIYLAVDKVAAGIVFIIAGLLFLLLDVLFTLEDRKQLDREHEYLMRKYIMKENVGKEILPEIKRKRGRPKKKLGRPSQYRYPGRPKGSKNKNKNKDYVIRSNSIKSKLMSRIQQ